MKRQRASDSQLIGLYGGTFDPVHLGHLAVAEAALADLGLGHITFIPAGDPPLRGAPGASAEDRLTMLRLALAHRTRMQIDDREIRRQGRSFTLDTLLAWRAEQGLRQPLAWLIGADAFSRLEAWHRWRELVDVAHFIVVARPHNAQLVAAPRISGPESIVEVDAALATRLTPLLREFVRPRLAHSIAACHAQPAGLIYGFSGPHSSASASVVRARCAAGESAADLLTSEVWAYIKQRQLYGWR